MWPPCCGIRRLQRTQAPRCLDLLPTPREVKRCSRGFWCDTAFSCSPNDCLSEEKTGWSLKSQDRDTNRPISSCINLTSFSDRIFSQSKLLPKTTHDLGLKTSIQNFNSFVGCTLMENQPWPQFQNGIRERSVVCVRLECSKFGLSFISAIIWGFSCNFGGNFFHSNCLLMISLIDCK